MYLDFTNLYSDAPSLKEERNPLNTFPVWEAPDKLTKRLSEKMPPEILGAFFDYVKTLQGRANSYFASNYPDLHGDQITFEVGRRFIRIVRNSGGADADGSRVAVCFVEIATGTVWKARSWKSPSLNFPRGNVYAPAGIHHEGWGHY